MKRLLVLTAVTLVAAGGVAPAVSGGPAMSSTSDMSALRAAPVLTDAPYCGLVWGSLPEADPSSTTAPITNLRAGRHTCFDRLVVDLGTEAPHFPAGPVGYNVSYVPQVVEDGSGHPVPLAGGAFLQIIVHAQAHDFETVQPTYNPPDPSHAVNVNGFSTFRQVAFAGTFEGQTTIGLGVRARLPFRVFVLAGPGSGSRLVIDVAHFW